MKLTSLASAATEALRARGVREPAASLAAEAGIAVFKVGVRGWIGDAKKRDLPHHLRSALGELHAVVGPKRSSARRPG
ncbi:MAG TPA: hypothetical protein VMB50_02950 [Myxococcales bacterium]|nr:hypothetical protein [Myxococcales bacterium]